MDSAARFQAAEPSALHRLASLFDDLPGMVSDRVQLLALEAHRARLAATQALAYALGAALLGATAWLALWLGIVAAALESGVPWEWAVAAVVLINGGLACWAALRALGLLRSVGLPATLRRLTLPGDPAQGDEPA